jgi:hypothetical protein
VVWWGGFSELKLKQAWKKTTKGKFKGQPTKHWRRQYLTLRQQRSDMFAQRVSAHLDLLSDYLSFLKRCRSVAFRASMRHPTNHALTFCFCYPFCIVTGRNDVRCEQEPQQQP